MAFREYVGALVKDLGVAIEIEDNACALSLGAEDEHPIAILVQGFDERGTVLTCADLGEPPPEGREKLYKVLLEANDLYGDTAGATLSLDRRNGHIRLQRYDDMDTLVMIGPGKPLVAFADTAAAWRRLISDFRDTIHDDADAIGAPSGAMLV